MLELEACIVGTAAARPYAGSPTSALFISSGGSRILIDCGEGTQVQLDALGLSAAKLDVVCITHMHGDHLYGLPGLLASLTLGGRTRALTLVGPSQLSGYLTSVFEFSHAACGFPLTFITTDDTAPQLNVFELRELSISTVPLRHRIPAAGFCVSTKTKGRNLLPGVVETYQLPYSAIPAIKAGGDFTTPDGQHIGIDTLTSAADPVRSIAYLTDTAVLDDWPTQLPSPTLLVHDATFTAADSALAEKTGHSTSTQAAAFAKTCGARHLLLTHISMRYSDRALLAEEARAVFAESELAEVGRRYLV